MSRKLLTIGTMIPLSLAAAVSIAPAAAGSATQSATRFVPGYNRALSEYPKPYSKKWCKKLLKNTPDPKGSSDPDVAKCISLWGDFSGGGGGGTPPSPPPPPPPSSTKFGGKCTPGPESLVATFGPIAGSKSYRVDVSISGLENANEVWQIIAYSKGGAWVKTVSAGNNDSLASDLTVVSAGPTDKFDLYGNRTSPASPSHLCAIYGADPK